ncbi:peptidase T [Lacrimispora amygdalina]|uniref:Peptidase T n=1 Tax=Lacrimispora amygdalina TaxID=253257 RepID=A0A3E2NCG0_9FIRM|nr:peptidase T [Clostridium indicum]RFZ78698.1 peptidase T [Clostridium indicum]
MSEVINHFLKYVSYDTQSKYEVDAVPSTSKQRILAEELVKELQAMKAADVRIDEHSYVYATIPATMDKAVPVLGFIAHMDTSPAYSGAGVKPQIVTNYDGKDILMNADTGLTMSPEDFPDLLKYVGQDIITTDGTTLLGADDKAGVAEIMTMAEYLLTHPKIPHGTIRIGFTPDEEVGRGADFFDVKGFAADVAYTVDGGGLGELEYENFNAASARVLIHGSSIHPGSSKGRMRNALLMGMEFHNMLPAAENPMYTEGYEGFYHLDSMIGSVEEARLDYIIRDHSKKKFEEKKEFMTRVADYLNQRYQSGTVELILKDSYFNMKEKIEPHMYLIDIAKTAMEDLGIEPLVTPIRGGTDGARLSYEGLPCPNLCTGGYNYHGKFEFIPVQSMEKVVKLLLKIVEKFAEK